MIESSTILRRLENTQKRLKNIDSADSTAALVAEVNDRISILIGYKDTEVDNQSLDGWENIKLGNTPLLTAKIIYQLDRCEDLLNYLEEDHTRITSKRKVSNNLLYPTIGEAIVGRLFAALVYFRGRIFNYEVKCNSPTLREILYLKCPFWLEPFARWILPKRRPEWSYRPKIKIFFHSKKNN